MSSAPALPLELASDPEVRRVYLGEGFRLDGREA